MPSSKSEIDQSSPAPLKFDFAAFEARRAQEREAFLEKLVMLKSTLFEFLATHGIKRVTAAFDGCGDSGQIDEIQAFITEGAAELPIDEFRMPEWQVDQNGEAFAQSISDVLETLAYDLLETHHGGWEINDGAYGEFVFDVEAQTISLEFNERYTATNLSEHSW